MRASRSREQPSRRATSAVLVPAASSRAASFQLARAVSLPAALV
jgi:hypothetical protein